MSCERNQKCFQPQQDPLAAEGRALAELLDNRQPEQVANYLRQDSYNMSPAAFNKVINEARRNDRKGVGADLYIDNDGLVVIDTRNRNGDQIVVATRDYDQRMGRVPQHHDDRQVDRRGQPIYRPVDPRDHQGQRRDAVTDTVVDGVVGAAVGAAINGRKGALAGGAGAVAGKMVDQVGGPNNRDQVTDTVVKGVVGAAVGAAIDGKEGAKAGAAGVLVGKGLDWLRNK